MIKTCTPHNLKAWGKKVGKGLPLALAGVLAVTLMQPAFATDEQRRQAKRMHDRLTGVAPSEAVLDAMEQEIQSNGAVSAALLAIDPAQNSHAFNFYNVTLKNFATPWTNREQSVFAPLNDYTATVIGMVRDNIPFNQVLYEDHLYIGDDTIAGVSAYSPADNTHYQNLEDLNVNLSDPSNLFRVPQSSMNGIPATDTAGVMTTRAAAEAFFIAGTNRAMFRFTLMNHLCTDLEPLKDTSLPSDRIRQDVSRSPGGDSRIFLNSCAGCHTGMDPMAQAFAYYNYDETLGRLVFTDGQVQPKYLINSDNFKPGYVTPDDHWDNYWREGQNSILGWSSSPPNGSGDGAKSLGQELSNSDAFSRCQVIKVYRAVCLGEPGQSDLDALKPGFDADMNMRNLFASTAAHCMGD